MMKDKVLLWSVNTVTVLSLTAEGRGCEQQKAIISHNKPLTTTNTNWKHVVRSSNRKLSPHKHICMDKSLQMHPHQPWLTMYSMQEPSYSVCLKETANVQSNPGSQSKKETHTYTPPFSFLPLNPSVSRLHFMPAGIFLKWQYFDADWGIHYHYFNFHAKVFCVCVCVRGRGCVRVHDWKTKTERYTNLLCGDAVSTSVFAWK